MATIEWRGERSWRVGVRIKQLDGSFEWVRRNLKFPPGMTETAMRKKAELEAARLELEAEDGELSQRMEYTVRSFAELYLDTHVRPHTSAANLRTVTNFLNHRILPAMGDVPLHKVNALMLDQFFNSVRSAPKTSTALPPEQRKRKPTQVEVDRWEQQQRDPRPKTLSERTVLDYYTCLNAMLERAVRWHILDVNPMVDVDRPKKKRPKLKILDDDQAVQLLRLLANEEDMSFRAAVLLALLCGLRLGEVGGLIFSDVDWAHSTIDISRALKYSPERGGFLGDPKSEAGVRLISLPVAMLVLLDETRKYHAEVAQLLGDRWRGDGRIICGWDGAPLHHDTPSKQWRKFADRHGFEGVRFHDLRHSHASILLANNVDAVSVASRMGHSSAEETLRDYAHAMRKRDHASASVMQQLFQGEATDIERLQTLHPAIKVIDHHDT